MELCKGVGNWFTATLSETDQSSSSPQAAFCSLTPDPIAENSTSPPFKQSEIDAEVELRLDTLQSEVTELRHLYDSETKRREEQEMINQNALTKVIDLEAQMQHLEERLAVERSKNAGVMVAFERLLSVVQKLQQLATNLSSSREAFIDGADIQRDEIEAWVQFIKG